MFINPLITKRKWIRLVPIIGPVTEQNPNIKVINFGLRGSLSDYLKGRVLMANITMTDSQQVNLSTSAKDRKGNPTQLPSGSSMQWLVDKPEVLTLTPSTDGMGCMIAAAGPLGTATVSVKAVDADGNTEAAGSIDFTIISGAPVTIDVAGDQPVEQP